MLFDICLILLKSVITLAVIYFLVILYLHLRAISRVSFYEKQGAVVFPGAKRFYFGNSVDFIEYGKARNGQEVVTGPNAWLIFKLFPRVMGFAEDKEFSAAEYPLVVCNF